MKEIFVNINIKEYESRYKISNMGRVVSLKTNKELKPFKVGKYRNYLAVRFYNKDGTRKGKDFKIHRLVAMHFIPNPNNYPQVNHIDGNTFNNKLDNLEWCNNSMNQKHAWDNGLNHTTDKHMETLEECKVKVNISNIMPVVEFDNDYNFRHIYGSVAEAERLTGFKSVGHNCRFETYHSGYSKFRFFKDCKLNTPIIVISGKSASGKNYITNKLCENGFNELISHTTRPMRKNEVNGVTYNFINKDEMKELNSKAMFIEIREYNTEYGKWYYGLTINEMIKSNPICILDLHGLKTLKNKIGSHNIISIYIDVDDDIRYERSLKRENIDDRKLEEIKRRFDSDNIDFKKSEIVKEYDYIYKNNSIEDFNNIIHDISILKSDNNDFNIKPITFKHGEIKYNDKYFYTVKELCSYLNLDYASIRYCMDIKKYELQKAIEYNKMIKKYKRVDKIFTCDSIEGVFINVSNLKKYLSAYLNKPIGVDVIYKYFRREIDSIYGFNFKIISFDEYYKNFIKENIDYELLIY